MFQVQEFMDKLDRIYQSGHMGQAEEYLLDGLKQTENQNKTASLTILNELIGYYRAVSRYEDGARCAAQAMALIEEMGLQETLNHGTTMLNIATGLRAAGKYEQAEAYYKKAQDIFEKELVEPDYRLASLHNNMGLLYAQTERLNQAKEHILKALELIDKFPGMESERAITFTNLGNVCFRLNQIEQAAAYMKNAVALFEKDSDHPDPHYPSALSGLGEACFHKGDLEEAQEYYQKALRWIERIYGKNDDWKTTNRNLETVQNLIRRKEAIRANGLRGLDLSKAYYEEVGKPMLQKKYPQYMKRIAVGLAGEGSECLGFDDCYSTDHDFGPGFCMWLTKEDYEEIGQALQEDYDALPKQWKGFPARNITAEGAGRVGVMEIDSYYRKFTGHPQAPIVKNLQDVLIWGAVPPEMLRTAVSGQVFVDELGVFTQRRKSFSEYPEPVRLYRLAGVLSKMAQAGQYNYGRAKKRGDIGMIYSSLAEFIQSAAEAGYLLNHSYMPFYKWRIRGMEDFTSVTELKVMLEGLMEQRADSADTEEKIEEVCAYIVKELQVQNLTDTAETFLNTQKEAVLRHMKELLCMQEETTVDKGSERPIHKIPDSRKDLIDRIVAQEWQQFQRVNNEGGRARCQDDRTTFDIMRKSQFYTWNDAVLNSYLEDLNNAEHSGWNLVMEKYARMMEHTAPASYKDLAKSLPERGQLRIQLQELMVCIMMRWTHSMQQQYPHLVKMGRKLSSNEDADWDISSETYLRGELGTYSDKTLRLYAQMILGYMEQKDNPVEDNLNYMVHFYGYESLKDADRKCAVK